MPMSPHAEFQGLVNGRNVRNNACFLRLNMLVLRWFRAKIIGNKGIQGHSIGFGRDNGKGNGNYYLGLRDFLAVRPVEVNLRMQALGLYLPNWLSLCVAGFAPNGFADPLPVGSQNRGP